MITLFHPHPCLINLSALGKQANGSVGGSTENKTNYQLLVTYGEVAFSHCSFFCLYVGKVH